MRSEEEGFQGSWHPGTVISIDCKRRRHVKYHNFQNDDGTSVVDVVPVSPILDGLDSGNVDRSCYRGSIRPFPPKLELSKSKLEYGLCVDYFLDEAWCEGVIFDHNDGSEERMIFFPDLGDELKTGIDKLRITQDWDEATDSWQQRGVWVFLELIEKYKQECFIAGVSLKQIWYDVRVTEGFEENIKEWTCPIRDVWEELVVKVIDDNRNITVDALIRDLDWARCMPPEAEESQETQVIDDNRNITVDALIRDLDWPRCMPPEAEESQETQVDLDSAEFVSNATPIAWLDPKSNAVVPFSDLPKCILPLEDKNRLSCNLVYSRKRTGSFRRKLGTMQMATPTPSSCNLVYSRKRTGSFRRKLGTMQMATPTLSTTS
ncbi:PREDICTED: uncharacterized protein LOC101290780 [Fragaria vesca subsp. vesca]